MKCELVVFEDRVAKFMDALEACSILLFKDKISSCNLGQASHVPMSLDLGDFGTLTLGDSLGGITNCSFFRYALFLFGISASNLRIIIFWVPMV